MGHSHSRIQSGHKPPIFSQLGRASSEQINLQIPTRTSSICQYQDPPAQQCTETQNTESMPPLPGYTSKTKRRRFWKPTVLISLQDRSFEDSIMYKHLRQTLERHATLKYADDVETCIRSLDSWKPPHAAIVVDAGIIDHRDVGRACALYANAGGRVVCAVNFAN